MPIPQRRPTRLLMRHSQSLPTRSLRWALWRTLPRPIPRRWRTLHTSQTPSTRGPRQVRLALHHAHLVIAPPAPFLVVVHLLLRMLLLRVLAAPGVFPAAGAVGFALWRGGREVVSFAGSGGKGVGVGLWRRGLVVGPGAAAV